MSDLLEIIKKARKDKNFTQSQVADKIGIGLRQYQNIEGGQFPKYKTKQISALEEILGIDIYEQIYEQNIQLNEPVAHYGLKLSLTEELERLSALHEKGKLTDEEFTIAKDKILKQ